MPGVIKEYLDFRLQNDNLISIDPNVASVKVEIIKDLFYHVNIQKLYSTIIKKRTTDKKFALSKINSDNLIDLMIRINDFLIWRPIKGAQGFALLKIINEKRKGVFYKTFYDICKVGNSSDYVAITYENIGGEITFGTMNLVDLLLYYNSTKYWEPARDY